MASDQDALEGVDRPGGGETALEAHRGGDAEAEQSVNGDRVIDANPLGLIFGIVVRQLVSGQVGPHVQRAEREVAPSRGRDDG